MASVFFFVNFFKCILYSIVVNRYSMSSRTLSNYTIGKLLERTNIITIKIELKKKIYTFREIPIKKKKKHYIPLLRLYIFFPYTFVKF